MKFNFEDYYNKTNPDDSLLFHYTSEYIAIEHILKSCNLKFSSRENSHDPFEQDEFLHVYDDSNYHQLDQIKNDADVISDFIDEINEIRNQVKYACFCVDSDKALEYPWNKGCFRSRMWSQYANAHKGVCLVFDESVLLESVYEEIPDNHLSFRKGSKIDYIDKQDDEVYEISSKDHNLSCLDRFIKYKKQYLFTKLKDYEHENEYRICIYDGKDSSTIYVNIRNALKGIIVGHHFPDVYLPVMKNVNQRLELPIIRAIWFKGKPLFEDVDLS